MWLAPPPAPYRKSPGKVPVQREPLQSSSVEPHPVSNSRCPDWPIARLVPPTDVTSGLESGKPAEILPVAARLSPSSPDAKMIDMPCASACWKTMLSACTSPLDTSSSASPQL